MRRIKRIETVFDPAAAAGQVALQQRVIGVVAGIAFVAAQIDSAAEADRQIGVDLDEAAIIALIIIVAGPALAGDEFQRECLALRQRNVLDGAAAAFGDGGAHHRIQPVVRDDERVLEGVHAIGERSVAGGEPFDPGEDRVVK